MEQLEKVTKGKGGRRKKDIKMDQLLSMKCTREDRRKIQDRAKSVNLSVSHFIRELALNGQIDRREIVFPGEVLQLIGTVNHAAANLNQIAKKRNGIEELNALERAELQIRSRELKQLAQDIKSYLK